MAFIGQHSMHKEQSVQPSLMTNRSFSIANNLSGQITAHPRHSPHKSSSISTGIF